MDYQDLDQTTRQIIDSRLKNATNIAPNADEAIQKGQLQDFKPESFDYGKMASEGAIGRKANRLYEDEVNKLKTTQKVQYPQQQMTQMLNSAQLGLGALKYDQARQVAMNQRRINEEAQRASIIGSVMGVAGTIVGAYYGGVGGAAAGGAAGKAIGNNMGGSGGGSSSMS